MSGGPPPRLPGQDDVEQVITQTEHEPAVRPGEVLAGDEVKALMRGCSRTAASGVRNRALIALLWRTGLRLGEALALKPRDVDHHNGVVVVLRPKRGAGRPTKPRKVGIDDDTLERVDRWLERRARLVVPAAAPLFCTLRGGKLDQAYVRRTLHRLARRPRRAPHDGEDPGTIAPVIDADRRVHPHGLRHTFAHELYRETGDVAAVQQALGHQHMRTTYVYLRELAPAVVEVMRARRWDDADHQAA